MPLSKAKQQVTGGFELPTSVKTSALNSEQLILIDSSNNLYRITKANLLTGLSNGGLTIPENTLTSAADGDYFIGIASDNSLYKITKANLLAGLSSGGTGGGEPTIHQNLLTWSEDFSNNAWSKSFSSVVADATTGYDGSTTADAITFAATSGQIYRYISDGVNVIAGQTYCHSIYLKTDSGNFELALSRTNQASWSGATVKVITVTPTWQRFFLTYTVPGGETKSDFGIGSHGLAPGYTLPATGTVYAWGAQVNAGSTPTTYQPTTNAIYP